MTRRPLKMDVSLLDLSKHVGDFEIYLTGMRTVEKGIKCDFLRLFQ